MLTVKLFWKYDAVSSLNFLFFLSNPSGYYILLDKSLLRDQAVYSETFN